MAVADSLTEDQAPKRHSAQFTVSLKGGQVTMQLNDATASEILEWIGPILDYLRQDQAAEIRVAR